MTQKIFTEGQHRAEFLLAEVEGGTITREVGTLSAAILAATPEQFADGRVVALSAGSLIPALGTVDANGVSDENIVGILFGPIAGEAANKRVYLARLGEVKASMVTFLDPAHAANLAAVKAALAKLFIIAR